MVTKSKGHIRIFILGVVLLFCCGNAAAIEGGPDAYGYRFVDSRNGGIKYEYINLDHQGENVGSYGHITGTDPNETDPEFVMGSIEIGFDFEFYGQTYTHVFPAPNGYLIFAPKFPDGYDNHEYGGGGIPSESQPNNIIAPLWGNLDTFA